MPYTRFFYVFVELLKEYRKLDDTVTMRLNRTVAQFRDRGIQGTSRSNSQDDACAFFWRELVGLFAVCIFHEDL